MKNILSVLVLFLLLQPLLGQNGHKESGRRREIFVCKVTLTESGRTANFRFSYRYSVTSDVNGKLTKTKKLHKKRPKFINEGDLVTCMESWTLAPKQKYLAFFSLGTNNSNKNYLSIVSSKETFKINIGTLGEELVIGDARNASDQ